MWAMLILTTSIALQFVAACLALRLIQITRRRTGWTMIAAAVSLMGLPTMYYLVRLPFWESGVGSRPVDRVDCSDHLGSGGCRHRVIWPDGSVHWIVGQGNPSLATRESLCG